MDFFTNQDQARKRTGHLVLLFCGAVIALIVLVNVLLSAVLWGLQTHGKSSAAFYDPDTGRVVEPGLFTYMTVEQWVLVALGVITVVLLASGVKWMSLRGGGRKVAESLGGRLLLPQTKDFYERRLLNVVEEMAIASGMPVPPVYVLEDESINAFAAGYQPSDAVVGVTRGTMTKLSRDQLQGVLAHEFSHIFNGDMRLNIRLMAVLFGILFIGLIGRFFLEAAARSSRVRSKDNNPLVFLGLGAGLMAIGYGGVFFGSLIKAAVSRQREFLADASAVQFTRNPDSIGGALKVIGYGPGSDISSPEREETAHMFFGQAMHFRFSGFATHPPLDERIRRVDPHWDGRYQPPQERQQAEEDDPEIAAASVSPASAEAFSAVAPLAAVVTALDRGGIEYTPAGDSAEQSSSEDHDSALEKLSEAARDTYNARALVVGMLLASPERMVHETQLDLIRQQQGTDFLKQVLRSLPLLQKILAEERLPLVERSIPALKQLSPQQYQSYRQLLVQLAKADGEIDIFEWCLYRLILQYLNPHFDTVQPIAARHAKAEKLSAEISAVLSVLCWFGHERPELAEGAFAAAAKAGGFEGLTLQPRSNSLKPLNVALAKLTEAYPHVKGRLVKAMKTCMDYDGQQRPVELDLVRTMAAILEVPVVLTQH